MKQYTAIISIVFVSIFGNAQIDEAAFSRKMEMNNEGKDFSWSYKNFFIDGKISAVSSYMYLNRDTSIFALTDAFDPSEDTLTVTSRGWHLGIAGFTFEPRINLVNWKKSALFVKAPIEFALSVTRLKVKFITEYNDFSRELGVFNFNAPILFGIAFGNNSTYNNASKRGFALSAGYQVIFTPLLGGKKPIKENYTFEYQTGSSWQYTEKKWEDYYTPNKSHLMPIVQLDYYKLNKNNKIRGFSASFCPYGTIYVKFAMNFALTKK